MEANQTNFSNGLDQIANDAQIDSSAYLLLINARQRFGYVEPNKKAEEITTLPIGKKQGGIGVGDIRIVFIAGSAYYSFDDIVWLKIANFTMDATVDRYFSIAVPAGNVGYSRTLDPSGDVSKPIIKKIDFKINGTPAAVIVQDGINQPQLIIFDTSTQAFISRPAQNYSQWLPDNMHQEYVPIGTQMLVVDAKLYIVSVDGKNMYQSISGRYLDFMVNVDIDGNKLATEDIGGAKSTSFNFDSDTITCIASSSVPSSFIYGTARNTRIIGLDYNNTILGEPTYFVITALHVGVVNQDCVQDILGDYALVDQEGIKSFNAVQQFKFQGRNSIFSLQASRLLHDRIKNKAIKQVRPRSVVFNDYAIFNVDSVYGNIFLVYDIILQKWVSIDIIDCFGVKQFFIIETTTESVLYAITSQDKLFKLYSSLSRETAQLYTKAYAAVVEESRSNSITGTAYSPGLMREQKSEFFKLFFQGGSEETNVKITELVDGDFSKSLSKLLPSQLSGLQFPFQFPIIFSENTNEQPITFSMKDGKKGHKLRYVIQWNNDSKLQAIEIKTAEDIPNVGRKQMERTIEPNYA